MRELRGQVEFRGHGYKDSDVMMRGQDKNTTRYLNGRTSATKSGFI